MIGVFVRDFRYGFRTMCRDPGLTLTIVMTLALGMGPNTSVFSLVSALMLRPIPLVLVAAGLAAYLFPMHQALRVDPAIALRAE